MNPSVAEVPGVRPANNQAVWWRACEESKADYSISVQGRSIAKALRARNGAARVLQHVEFSGTPRDFRGSPAMLDKKGTRSHPLASFANPRNVGLDDIGLSLHVCRDLRLLAAVGCCCVVSLQYPSSTHLSMSLSCRGPKSPAYLVPGS